MAMKQKSHPPVNELSINESKWSKTLMAAGWTVLPTVLIEQQRKMGLDPIDMNILLHLASYWWLSDKKPHPSKKTIALAMGVHPRTVQRHIANLEKKRLIKREQRRIAGKGSKTNLYHFDGLIAAALPFAEEKITRKKWRMEVLQEQGPSAPSMHRGKD